MTPIATLITIHGFLGNPRDFEALAWTGQRLDLDLFGIHALREGESKAEWLVRIEKIIAALPSPRLIVGYSLGGRIGLELLNRNGEVATAMVLLAAHPGLLKEEDRDARWQSDEIWAEKILRLDDETLMHEWNDQLVFRESRPLTELPQAPRSLLAQTLRTFSLARQPDFTPLLAEGGCRIRYLVGARDERFLAVARRLEVECPCVTIEIIPEAGHRILADRPDAVSVWLDAGLEGS